MLIKKDLRKLYTDKRSKVADKSEKDFIISENLFKSSFYKNAKNILIYVSAGSEIDTRGIITTALSDNKNVAVPYCSGKEMRFYQIFSLDDLTERQYNIPTVNTVKRNPFLCTPDTLCIVPGLAFDLQGNRLGYGGGFYDRFLSSADVIPVALAYECCMTDELPAEPFDVKIPNIITENGLIKL